MSLIPIQGRMVAPEHTVAAFAAVDARYDGALIISAPDGAHRTRARQAWLRAEYLAGRGEYAAPPGGSQHENPDLGALDINNWALFPDLRDVMAAHGFVRDPREPWHYNDRGTWLAGGDIQPIDETEEPETMNLFYEDADTGAIYVLDLSVIAPAPAIKLIGKHSGTASTAALGIDFSKVNVAKLKGSYINDLLGYHGLQPVQPKIAAALKGNVPPIKGL